MKVKEIVKPDAQEAEILWRDVLGQEVEHNATWLWEFSTDKSTDFAGKAKEGIEEGSKLKGPWIRWGPRNLAKEFHQFTPQCLPGRKKTTMDD